jgi:hypothetical protein
VQRWRGDIANSSRGHFYSIFKQEFCMEPYLTRLTEVHRKFITKLRVNNIKFPIETGRWRNINSTHSTFKTYWNKPLMHFINIDIFCSSFTLHKDSILDIFSKLALVVK